MAEKSLSDIPRPLRDLYEKGNAAAHRDNLEYALDIYTDVLQKEPAFYECREALRAAQIKKSGKSSGFFKKMIGSVNPLLAKGQLALRHNPAEAMNIAEQILNGDAHNASAHRLLAEGALALDLPKTAVMSLEIARKSSPKDRDLAIKLANAYVLNKQVDKADAVYNELLRANPNDAEIAMAYKNLGASRTMDMGYNKLENGGSFRDALKDKNESVRLEQEARSFKDEHTAHKLLDEYVDRLAADPSNLQLARQVADLYLQVKDYNKALKYYTMLAELPGVADATLAKAITTTSIKKFDQELAALDPQAPDYEETAKQLQAKKDAFQLEDCKERADKYPTDLAIKFELGVLYFKTGQVGEAIQEFQKSQKDAHRRIQSLYYLGQCFATRGMNELAIRQFQTAIKEKIGFDEEKKDLIYALGCVLEKMGKAEEAIKEFEKIYEVDIGYRDVQARVDAYYSGGGAQT